MTTKDLANKLKELRFELAISGSDMNKRDELKKEIEKIRKEYATQLKIEKGVFVEEYSEEKRKII